MYHSEPTAERAWMSDLYPREVARLYRREREIAMIVYERGLVTAKDVEAALSDPLRNAAVRSMLGRLVSKGILTQVKCGSRGTFVYGPALTPSAAREKALRQFAEDFGYRSLDDLAEAIADMFACETERSTAKTEAHTRIRLAS
jgi:predicted transcriptional regulator